MNWISIFESIISGAVVALIFGFFLKWLFERYKKPKLSMIVSLQDQLKDGTHWVTLAIRNDGRSAFQKDEVSWHLYWPDSFPAHYVQVDDRRRPVKDNGNRPYQILGPSKIDGKLYWHLGGSNKVTLHPQMETEITIFRLESAYEDYEEPIRYHFSTTLGLDPNKAFTWWGYEKIKDKNGFPKLHLLPKVKVRDIRKSKYKDKLFVPSAQPPDDRF